MDRAVNGLSNRHSAATLAALLFISNLTVLCLSAALPGSRIGTIQANDIDSHPHLTYSFLKGGNPLNAFSIDKFSGVLSMAKKLDREEGDRYKLLIAASDGAHNVDTSVDVCATFSIGTSVLICLPNLL